MGEFDQKPDIQFFDDALGYLTNKWSKTHEDWKIRDSYYRRDYDVWDKSKETANRTSYRPSTSTSIIDHAADTQLAFSPNASRPPPRPSAQESKEWSDDIENRMKAILDDASMREIMLPFKAMGKFLLHLGYGVLELGWDTTDRDGADGQSYNPVRLSAPHPSTILLDPDEKNPELGIKLFSMRAGELAAWTERMRNPSDNVEHDDVHIFKVKSNPFEMVTLAYLWIPDWTMLRLHGGEELFTASNAWGFIPWAHAFAGYGMEMTDLNERDPLWNAQGLLSPIIQTIKASAQAESAKHQILMDRAYPQAGSTQDPEEIAEQQERAGLLQGEKTDFWFMEQVELGREIFEVGRGYAQEMAEGTYNRALTGARQEGVDTVGQQAILSNAASKKFSVPAVQMQAAASITAGNILKLITILGESIGINGQMITKKMVEDDSTITISFETPDPVLQIQNREIGMREVAQGLKSTERYWREDSRLEDITSERDARDRDILDNHPAIINQRAKRVAIEQGIDLDEAIAELEQDEAEASQRRQTRSRGGSEGARGPQRNIPADTTLIREGITPAVQSPARLPAGQPGG